MKGLNTLLNQPNMNVVKCGRKDGKYVAERLCGAGGARYAQRGHHLALDRPDPKADALGEYTAGFIAPVMGDTYLKQHDAPEDREYLCGPPMMAKTVLDLLHSLGVDDADIRFDSRALPSVHELTTSSLLKVLGHAPLSPQIKICGGPIGGFLL